MVLDKMVQALQSGSFFVDQGQVQWVLQGDPQCAFCPASSNEDIEISLVPRQWLVFLCEEQ